MTEKKPFTEWDVSLCADFIKSFEGERLKAYQCSAGVWTIGVGHTQGVKPGDVLTPEESNALFLADLWHFKKKMTPLVSIDVTEGQFIALMSFVFNVGVNAFMTSTLRKRLNEGDLTQASFEFLKWKFAGGVVVKGLLNRRMAERELFGK